jgi:hypothetical protein
VLGVLLGVSALVAAADAPPLGGAPAAADRQALERALAVDGLDRSPSPPESSYLRDVGVAIQRAVARLFARGSLLPAPRRVLLAVVALVGTAALLALFFKILLPVWRERRSRRRRSGAGETVSSPLPAAAAEMDAAAWRAELDRCLAEGRIAEGLQAAWWWLARSVAGARAEPTWTGRDLLTQIRGDDRRRHDLRELVRRLDTLLYGPERPGLDDLRRLVGRMEETLA